MIFCLFLFFNRMTWMYQIPHISLESVRNIRNVIKLNILKTLCVFWVFSGAGNRLDGKKKGTDPSPVEVQSTTPKRSVILDTLYMFMFIDRSKEREGGEDGDDYDSCNPSPPLKFLKIKGSNRAKQKKKKRRDKRKSCMFKFCLYAHIFITCINIVFFPS